MGWKKFCCVPRCPRHDPADVKSSDIFHKLPSNPEARTKWVELLGIPEENAFVHYRNVVCSLHFEAEKFHSPICLLLKDVYNQTNTCTRACSAIPKGVLPIRFCPQDVIQRSSCSSTTASAVSTSQPSINTANYASSSALNDFIKVVPGKGTKPLSVYLPQSETTFIKEENPLPDEIVSVSSQAAEKKTQKDPLALPVTPTVIATSSAVPLQQAVVISTAIAKNKAPLVTKIRSAAMKPPPPPKSMNNLRVPLTTSMLLEMANGMEMDPEANLKLEWTENESIEVNTEDVTKMCRMCAKVGMRLTPIFGDSSTSSELAIKINQCLSFQVSKYDALPLSICLPCERMVLRTHQFYMQCKEANAKLRLLMVQKNTHIIPHVLPLPEISSSSPSNLHFGSTVTRILPKPKLPEKRKASQPNSCPIPPKMPVYKILFNPAPKPKKAVSSSPRPASKRTEVSKYPKVPPGTRTYSIYNFPDPKNLMQLPDYDCRFCPAMFCSTDSWARHTYSVHSKLMCPVCHSEFENRTEYEHHQVLDHNQPPILHSRFFNEFGNKTCTFCDAEFPRFNELTKHIRDRACPRLLTMLTGDAKLPPATKKYHCNFCNKVTSKRNNITEHITRHLGFKDFACEVCDKRFSDKKALMKHEATHSDHMGAQCEICGASFKLQSYLLQHMQKHNGRWNTKCSCCKATFRVEKVAEQHFLGHSKAARQKVNHVPWFKVNPFECDICGKHYKTDMYYLQHMKKHDASSSKFKDNESKAQLCSICGKKFSNRSNLVQHINRLHLPSENYECDICKRVIKGRSGFTQHLMSHLDPLITCNLCGRKFRGEIKLKSHTSRVHIDKKFCCEFCGKAFKLKKHLTVHIRVHTNERPFLCQYCDMSFKQIGDRSKHEAIHVKKQK